MSQQSKGRWGARAFLIVAGIFAAVGLIGLVILARGLNEKMSGIGGGDYPLGMSYGLAVERALVLEPAAWRGPVEVTSSHDSFHPLCDRAMLDDARARASKAEPITCAVFKERMDEVTCGRMDQWSCAILEFHPTLLGDPQIHALIAEVLWHPCDFLPSDYAGRRDVLACDDSSTVWRKIALRAGAEQEVVDFRIRPRGLTRGPILK